MAKRPSVVFVCQECGAQSPKWVGKCPDCGAWNSYVEERAVESQAGAAAALEHRYAMAGASGTARLYADIAIEQHARLSTGIGEFDRVLGGGIVPGSAVLVGGEPGIGKSTLLLQVANDLASGAGVAEALLNKRDRTLKKAGVTAIAEAPPDAGIKVLYVTSEESARQTKLRASRLGVTSSSIVALT